jgi:hypothetical protein
MYNSTLLSGEKQLTAVAITGGWDNRYNNPDCHLKK